MIIKAIAIKVKGEPVKTGFEYTIAGLDSLQDYIKRTITDKTVISISIDKVEG